MIAALRRALGCRLGFPVALALPTPLHWLAVALVTRALGAERWEAVAVGRCLKVAISTVRAGT